MSEARFSKYRRYALTPEKKLLFAMLERAYKDLRLTGHWSKKCGDPAAIRRDAYNWFVSHRRGPFTFDRVKEVLGLDRDALKEITNALRECLDMDKQAA